MPRHPPGTSACSCLQAHSAPVRPSVLTTSIKAGPFPTSHIPTRFLYCFSHSLRSSSSLACPSPMSAGASAPQIPRRRRRQLLCLWEGSDLALLLSCSLAAITLTRQECTTTPFRMLCITITLQLSPSDGSSMSSRAVVCSTSLSLSSSSLRGLRSAKAFYHLYSRLLLASWSRSARTSLSQLAVVWDFCWTALLVPQTSTRRSGQSVSQFAVISQYEDTS